MSSEEQTTLDKAAYDFKTNLDSGKSRTERMSRKGLVRVFKAVLEFPLGDKTPKFVDTSESELFILSINTLVAKNKMLTEVVREQADKLKQAEVAMAEQVKAEEQSNG